MKTFLLSIISIWFISLTVVSQSDQTSESLIKTAFNHTGGDWPDELINGDLLPNREILDLWLTDSIVSFNLNWETDSIAYYKSIYKYSDDYKTLEYLIFSKFPVDEKWKNVSKQVLTLNDNNLCIKSLAYQGDDQNWVLKEKSEYTHNSNNKYTSLTIFNWDNDSEIWNNHRKIEFMYNSQGLENGRIEYFADPVTHELKKMRKEEVIFNEFNQEIENSTMYWDVVNNNWINWVKNTYTYDNGVVSSVYYHWDSTDWKYYSRKDGIRTDLFTEVYKGYTFKNDSMWLHDYDEEIRYDNVGNIIFQESYAFMEADSVWTGRTKIYNNFNDLGQLLSIIHYDWRPTNGEWILSYKEQNVYNEQGIKYYNCTYSWVSSENRWNKNISSTSYFTHTSSIGNSELPHLFVRVYPNPCSNQIFLDFDGNENGTVDYQIFSVTGKLIAAGSAEKTKPISVEKLNSGLYLIQVQYGSRNYMGKFIKN